MLREKFRKTVTAPYSGVEFIIRRIATVDYLADLGILPSEVLPSVQEKLTDMQNQMTAKTKDPEFARRASRFLLERGVVSPPIWFGDNRECPEDHVPFDDLGPDLGHLTTEISAFSNDLASLKKNGPILPGGGTGDAPLGGEAIRTEAEQLPAEGNTTTGA